MSITTQERSALSSAITDGKVATSWEFCAVDGLPCITLKLAQMRGLNIDDALEVNPLQCFDSVDTWSLAEVVKADQAFNTAGADLALALGYRSPQGLHLAEREPGFLAQMALALDRGCRCCGTKPAYLGRLDVGHTPSRAGRAEMCEECHDTENYERQEEMRRDG